MGGFILNVRGEESEFFVLKTQTQLTIRPEAFPWIIRNAFEAIPDISEDEILDKSKANGLAKFIVCVQATWFCIQCVNRLALSLSISLLELNTFAHAICTLIIYILWWNKPLDVDGTTMLQGQSAKKVYNTLLYSSAASRNGHPTETHAYFLTFTSASLPRRRLKLKSISSEISPDILEPGLHGTNIVDEQPLDVADPTPRNMEFSDPRPPEVSDPRPHSKESSHEQPRAMVRVLPNTKLQHFDVIKAETDCTGPLASLRLPSLKYIDLSPGDFKNLELALDTLVNLEDYIVDITALSSRAPNLPLKTSTTLGLNSFVLSGLCYGSLHLTAWDAPFPTNTQKLLWRISGLSLVASGFLIWAEIYLIGTVAMLLDTPYWTRLRENCSNSYRNKVSKSFQLGLEGTLSLIFVLLHIMAFLLYIFCRVYLIVDCFIVLAHLPESVYRVPKWSQHFPHLR